ncbi:hypothetical protein CS542_07815 [Pedobacter sp. IW39]|nr:hypothetical protein CS542_07815 [Pedobacter sp. IW39]
MNSRDPLTILSANLLATPSSILLISWLSSILDLITEPEYWFDSWTHTEKFFYGDLTRKQHFARQPFLYEIGSISKTFTAVILALCDQPGQNQIK